MRTTSQIRWTCSNQHLKTSQSFATFVVTDLILITALSTKPLSWSSTCGAFSLAIQTSLFLDLHVFDIVFRSSCSSYCRNVPIALLGIQLLSLNHQSYIPIRTLLFGCTVSQFSGHLSCLAKREFSNIIVVPSAYATSPCGIASHRARKRYRIASLIC